MAMTNLKLDLFFVTAITQKLFAECYLNLYPVVFMKFFILHYFNFLKVAKPILYFQLLKNIVLSLIFVYAGSVQDRWDQSESEKNDYPETKSQIGTTTTVLY